MNRYKINRLVILSIFLLMGVGTLLLVNYLKSEQSTDLSHITIDDMHLNSTVDKNQLIEFDDIVLKKYKFYEKYNQPDLVFKVNKANNKLKGMSLLKNTKVKTNFGGEIEGHVQDVVRELGNNYKQKNYVIRII